MIEQRTLARPYAKAIFEIAKQQGNCAEWSTLLATLACITEDDQVKRLVRDATLSAQKIEDFYKDLYQDWAKTVLMEMGKNLIQLLSLKRRLALLPEINQLFSAFRLEAENTLVVQITTATPLTEAQKSVFSSFLEKQFGKKIILELALDEHLMGGYRIKAGDQIMDGSLKGLLDQLSTAIGG